MDDAFETILIAWLAFALLAQRPTHSRGGTDGSNPLFSAGDSVSPAPSAAIGAKSRLYRSPSTVSMNRPCWVAVSARVSPSELGPHDRSGVVISNDLPTNGSRFLVIHNGREIDVHIAIPLADPAVHGSKVIRLDNRYAGATDLS